MKKDRLTHTIRRRKGSPPIVTFKPWFMELLRQAHPEAMSLFVGRFFNDFVRIGATKHSLCHLQEAELNSLDKSDKYRTIGEADDAPGCYRKYGYECIRFFRDGYLNNPNLGDMERNLEILNLFYRAADTAFFNPEVSNGKR